MRGLPPSTSQGSKHTQLAYQKIHQTGSVSTPPLIDCQAYGNGLKQHHLKPLGGLIPCTTKMTQRNGVRAFLTPKPTAYCSCGPTPMSYRPSGDDAKRYISRPHPQAHAPPTRPIAPFGSSPKAQPKMRLATRHNLCARNRPLNQYRDYYSSRHAKQAPHGGQLSSNIRYRCRGNGQCRRHLSETQSNHHYGFPGNLL